MKIFKTWYFSNPGECISFMRVQHPPWKIRWPDLKRCPLNFQILETPPPSTLETPKLQSPRFQRGSSSYEHVLTFPRFTVHFCFPPRSTVNRGMTVYIVYSSLDIEAKCQYLSNAPRILSYLLVLYPFCPVPFACNWMRGINWDPHRMRGINRDLRPPSINVR